MLASAFDATVQRHLAGGGRALLLVNDENALRGLDVEVKSREGNEYDGRWQLGQSGASTTSASGSQTTSSVPAAWSFAVSSVRTSSLG